MDWMEYFRCTSFWYTFDKFVLPAQGKEGGALLTRKQLP